jgi:outer membrane immunogenic protein
VKRNLVCVIALLTLGTVGAAADELANRPAIYVVGPTAELPWAGFFVGVNGGYGWAHSSIGYAANDPAAAAGTCGGVGRGQCVPSLDFTQHGGTAGGQIGFDWQINPLWLVGVAADYQWADIRSGGQSAFRLGNVGSTTMFAEQSVNSFGTIRARLGVVPATPLLLYGTGGLAFGQVKQDSNIANPNITGTNSLSSGGFSYSCPAGGPPCFAGSSSKMEWGWTIGGGGEFKITQNITFVTEVLFVQLDTPQGTSVAQKALAGTTPSSFTAILPDEKFIVARGGFNFRF